MLIEDPRNRKTVAHMLDHHWISHLIPTDSQFQRAPPASPSPSESSATPPTTDGAIACSQSMENLNLSDLPIPGLSTVNQDATVQKPAMTGSSDAVQQGTDSFASDFSVTAKIPGAFPKPKKGKARLAVVDEAVTDGTPWDSAVPRVKPGAPGPSRGAPSPPAQPVKRKSNLITGSSPLSSLSSEDEDEDATTREAPNKPITRRGVAPRSKSKAVEPSSHKRKGRPPSSISKLRRPTPKDEEEYGGRRSGRPPAKTPRYT